MKNFYMKKIISLMILININPLMSANWDLVSFNDETDNFIDTDSIKNSGGYIYYWRLADYKVLREYSDSRVYKSTMIYYKGDCNVFRELPLSGYIYSEYMGKGEILHSLDFEEKWQYPPPDSISEIALEVVCKYFFKDN